MKGKLRDVKVGGSSFEARCLQEAQNAGGRGRRRGVGSHVTRSNPHPRPHPPQLDPKPHHSTSKASHHSSKVNSNSGQFSQSLLYPSILQPKRHNNAFPTTPNPKIPNPKRFQTQQPPCRSVYFHSILLITHLSSIPLPPTFHLPFS